jgi:hypothetical protein
VSHWLLAQTNIWNALASSSCVYPEIGPRPKPINMALQLADLRILLQPQWRALERKLTPDNNFQGWLSGNKDQISNFYVLEPKCLCGKGGKRLLNQVGIPDTSHGDICDFKCSLGNQVVSASYYPVEAIGIHLKSGKFSHMAWFLITDKDILRCFGRKFMIMEGMRAEKTRVGSLLQFWSWISHKSPCAKDLVTSQRLHGKVVELLGCWA